VPDVFISYNREDRETARLVASALEAEGLSVWWDAALRAGETYDEVTEQNLRGAAAVVVLWSKRSANSKWVRAEATVGERSSSLVPVLIEDCERPIRFELVQTADLRHWRGDRNDPHWRAFMQDVRTAISKRGAKQQPSAATVSTPAYDASIETAFWNSIKDGTDRSDFEAYLARYPSGHFAMLARNRLTALSRQAAPPARPAAAAPVQQRPAAAAPAQRPAAVAPRPATQPAARTAAPAKKSMNGLLIGGVAVGVAAIGAFAFFMIQNSGKSAAVEPAPAAEAAANPAGPAAEEPPSTEPDADFVDVFSAEGAQGTDESAEIDIEGAPIDPSAAVGEAAPSAPLAPEPAPAASSPEVGETFRDCELCPLMAPLPAGRFLMGSPEDEPGRNAYEGPQRQVEVPAFAISVFEVTVSEWNACAADGVCAPKPAGADEKMPALSISFRDAEGYANWLTRKTGRKYRLPTEAEWEYAARAGTASAYWWGDRYDASNVSTREARAVGSAKANAFGLHDFIGNAREWVADCYVNNFTKAPADGSAVTDGDCSKRVIRGGGWASSASDMRVANRSRIDVGGRAGYMGVRIAAEVK
jgi:formylglycine-generating enzyme required for sulfatase activity